VSTADAEVVVVGGGPAGCATAITLVHAGVDVVLLAGARRPDASHYRPGEGAPPGTDVTVRQVFGSDADAFDATAHLRSYATRSVWGSSELATVDHMFNPFGPGWLLDRAAFDARLLHAVADAGVRVLHDAAVVHSAFDARWELALGAACGATTHVTARFVCDASGRRTVVARTHGARLVHQDRLTAITCTVPDEADCDPVITIQAAADGWWYTAPLPGRRRVVAFFTDPDLVDLTRLRDARELAALGPATEQSAFAADRVIGAPMIFPAGSRHLAAPVGKQWLAVGDAAATFDPLSSQGILTALLMGREAGRAAIDMCRGDTTDGDAARAQYLECFRRVVDQYDREHAEYYGAERRWPTSSFWARRHGRHGDHLQRAVTS
jgi:flavin-dependent dehydrogenase